MVDPAEIIWQKFPLKLILISCMSKRRIFSFESFYEKTQHLCPGEYISPS